MRPRRLVAIDEGPLQGVAPPSGNGRQNGPCNSLPLDLEAVAQRPLDQSRLADRRDLGSRSARGGVAGGRTSVSDDDAEVRQRYGRGALQASVRCRARHSRHEGHPGDREDSSQKRRNGSEGTALQHCRLQLGAGASSRGGESSQRRTPTAELYRRLEYDAKLPPLSIALLGRGMARSLLACLAFRGQRQTSQPTRSQLPATSSSSPTKIDQVRQENGPTKN